MNQNDDRLLYLMLTNAGRKGYVRSTPDQELLMDLSGNVSKKTTPDLNAAYATTNSQFFPS